MIISLFLFCNFKFYQLFFSSAGLLQTFNKQSICFKQRFLNFSKFYRDETFYVFQRNTSDYRKFKLIKQIAVVRTTKCFTATLIKCFHISHHPVVASSLKFTISLRKTNACKNSINSICLKARVVNVITVSIECTSSLQLIYLTFALLLLKH